MAAGFQNPFSGFQNPFQDFDLGRAFMGAPRPQPQDFMVPGSVITPGVSVNPHAGLDFKAVYAPEVRPGNIPVSAGGSGTHPGIESGYQPVYGQQNEAPNFLQPLYGEGYYEDIQIGMGGRGADQPAGITPYSAPPALGQSDAPTYQQRSEMLDAAKYSKELERWKLIENERLKRLGSLQEMLAYMGKQSGGGKASGGGGGTAPKSGRPTNLQMASMGVADKPEDPFRKLEEFYPFLGRYRNT
jgi:hypothetical protein